jgi:hypothetical protein
MSWAIAAVVTASRPRSRPPHAQCDAQTAVQHTATRGDIPTHASLLRGAAPRQR